MEDVGGLLVFRKTEKCDGPEQVVFCQGPLRLGCNVVSAGFAAGKHRGVCYRIPFHSCFTFACLLSLSSVPGAWP